MGSVRPGDLLAGKYRVERVLGQGGMGYVVAARHLQLDQLVAMKFLRHGALDEGEATARFLREARASVKLKNEHVARVFDVGTLETGEPYMVMEHLEGCDLSALAKQRGAIAVGEAVEFVMQACEALAEAHSLGIIHRDIKLANLFVSVGPAGAPLVKVLDFGISKTNPFGESEHEVTRTASMLGSPRFMSPEQMRDARAVDARTDIWSLGVVLYRLVGGKPPFEGESLGQLLSRVMHEHPMPLSSLRPDLPPGFEAVVARCLEKDPAARIASVAELAYALVPYAVDGMAARAAADRIAATLSLSASQSRGAPLRVPPGRPSGPPGASDTGGTASPWAGTGGRASRRPTASRAGAGIWSAVALVALLVGAGVFAKVKHDRSVARTRVAAEAPPAVAPALPALPAADTAVATTLAPPPVLPPPQAQVPPQVPRVPPQPPPILARKATDPATPAAATARKPARATPASAPKDDGIPSTRD